MIRVLKRTGETSEGGQMGMAVGKIAERLAVEAFGFRATAAGYLYSTFADCRAEPGTVWRSWRISHRVKRFRPWAKSWLQGARLSAENVWN